MLGKLFGGIHKAVKGIGGGVNKMMPPGIKKKTGGIGPSQGMMNKLSAPTSGKPGMALGRKRA